MDDPQCEIDTKPRRFVLHMKRYEIMPFHFSARLRRLQKQISRTWSGDQEPGKRQRARRQDKDDISSFKPLIKFSPRMKPTKKYNYQFIVL